jgi:AcrR family transcriptional regulator
MRRPVKKASRSAAKPGRGAGPGLRRRILDAARSQLIQHGYAHFSMRNIAARVGVSATSIYLYFDGKDTLVHGLIDEGMESLHADLLKSDDSAAAPAARLERLCLAYLEFGRANPEYYEIMFLLHPARMARYPAEKYRRARRNLEIFSAALAPLCPLGEDLRLTSHALWCLLHGAVSLRISGRMDSHVEADRLAAETVNRALRMVCAA